MCGLVKLYDFVVVVLNGQVASLWAHEKILTSLLSFLNLQILFSILQFIKCHVKSAQGLAHVALKVGKYGAYNWYYWNKLIYNTEHNTTVHQINIGENNISTKKAHSLCSLHAWLPYCDNSSRLMILFNKEYNTL